MSDREILSNAIDKAIANGMKWHNDKWNPFLSRDSHPYSIWIDTEIYKIFIFSHSFAKPFFGEEPINIGSYEEIEWIPAWEFHLMQMVREENPIAYLAKFL